MIPNVAPVAARDGEPDPAGAHDVVPATSTATRNIPSAAAVIASRERAEPARDDGSRANRGWRGFTMTSDGTRQLHDLRRALLDPPSRLRPERPLTSTEPTLTETVGAVAWHPHQ
ncbi:MAG: hypothetical protein ACYCXA_14525 [Actinomycetes bacterium]